MPLSNTVVAQLVNGEVRMFKMGMEITHQLGGNFIMSKFSHL